MNVTAQIVGRQAGLLWGPDLTPVPLEGVKVHAEVFGHGSRVTVAQRFRNAEKVPIEAVYVFPVPEGAAVCGLAMRVGDRRIEGEVREREEAFEAYDDAMTAGHGAALLDAERPNVFTISVGNILPGQEIVIELKWVSELPVEGDAIRFLLPTTVAPRYAPSEDREGLSPTPAERVSPPVELEVPYGFELDVDVELASPVRSVDSPSHPVRVEIDGRKARVALSHAVAAMDRDFVLLLTPSESSSPRVLVERNGDGLVTAAVSFVPRLEAREARTEVIFLVDRSGSMEGSSMEQVRAALQLCLRSLREGDRFNIVGFGSEFRALFPESRAYGQAALEEASRHVDGLDADLGGTEILPALEAVLATEPAGGMARQVVILTDGEVSNEAAVIELAERHSASTRIFTFGIGHGASEFLVRSLARVTRGQAEFIHPGERIEPKVLRQFARIATPAVLDVKVEWEGASVKLQAPYRAPAIFNREAGVIYARVEPTGPVTVRLSGTVDGKPVSWSLPVDVAQAESGDLLATLAARAAIRDLEEGTSARHDKPRGSSRQDRRGERVKNEIVALATAYRLASRETSFVAIERRDGGEARPAAELRRVPVALTFGWGGIGRSASPLVRAFALMPSAPPPSRSFYSVRLRRSAVSAKSCHHLVDHFAHPDLPDVVVGAAGGLDRAAMSAPAAPPERPHVAVARLQRADGCWLLTAKLCKVLGVSLDRLRAAAKSLDDGVEARSLVATLAALRFLESQAGDVRDEWRLFAEKAERWLEAALASRPPDTRPRLEALIEVGPHRRPGPPANTIP